MAASNRAELQALIAAVSGVATFQCNAQIWCDSKSTVQVATALQQGDHRCLRGTPDNHDLLAALAEQIQHTEPRQLSIHWIPSHLDADGFEEWICTWNNIADSIAFSFNESREPSLERILQMQTQWCNSWTHATRTMQTFYLAVADSIQHESEPQLPELQGGREPQLDWAAHVGHHSLAEQLPLAWFQTPSLGTGQCPVEFTAQLVAQLEEWDDVACQLEPISMIVLTQQAAFAFPGRANSGAQRMKPLRSLFTRPTFAFRSCLRLLCRSFGLGCFLLDGLDRSRSRITCRADGIVLRLAEAHRQRAIGLVGIFSNGRGLRKASELARPAV